MLFAENINRICKERGTTLTAVVREVRGSTSYVTSINNGYLPKESDMVEMARVLDCSVMDFFSDKSTPPVEHDAVQTVQDEDELDILRVFRTLPRRAKHEFMGIVYGFEDKAELVGDNGFYKVQ